jgi:hypothetical protein
MADLGSRKNPDEYFHAATASTPAIAMATIRPPRRATQGRTEGRDGTGPRRVCLRR